MQLTQSKIDQIPLNSLGVLAMHQCGIDLRSKMCDATYYKHKRLLAAYGFDISEPKQASKK